MKISWGVKITILYLGFVLLIVTMVVASSHQHFDLVSNSYYADEIKYQNVIDAGKNQAQLSHPVLISKGENAVTLQLPSELDGKMVTGTVQFYSPVDAAWDKQFPVEVDDHRIAISRGDLRKTRYTVKINLEAEGKKYYQESEVNLN
jgi:hypothetical protein